MADMTRLQDLLEQATELLDQAGQEIRNRNFNQATNLERILDSLTSICAIQEEIKARRVPGKSE